MLVRAAARAEMSRSPSRRPAILTSSVAASQSILRQALALVCRQPSRVLLYMSDWPSPCLQPVSSLPVSASCFFQILIVADSHAAAAAVLAALHAADLPLAWHIAPTLADYRTRLAEQAWDVALACQLPEPGADPLAFPLRVAEALQHQHLPPPAVLWTSPLGDRAAAACFQNGFSDYLLSTDTAKLATSLWRAGDRAAQQRQAWQQYRLGCLVSAMQAAGNAPEARLQALVTNLCEGLQASRCLLLQPNEDGLMEVTHLATSDPRDAAIAVGLTCPVAYHFQPHLVAGNLLHWSDCDRLADLPSLARETAQRAGLRALALAPLHWQQTYWGAIALHDCASPRPWQTVELDLLQAAASQAAQTLHQAHLARQLEERPPATPSSQHLAQLEQENRTKGELLSTMSHELRAPLTGILGFARMLNEQIYGPLNAKQEQYISAIASSGEYLLALIEDLLDLSRIEADREELYWETLVVDDVCLAALAIVESQAELQGLELRFELAPGVGTCRADQRRLKQILINLLSNAIKFTETGSITLAVWKSQQQLHFAVRDTGIGIAPEDCDRLFQPFCQIRNPLQRKHKGTGLGLALSRQLARLHGGDIRVESKPGCGSTFTLSLPLEPPGDRPTAAAD